MTTLRFFSQRFESIPAATAWYLSELGEAGGKQGYGAGSFVISKKGKSLNVSDAVQALYGKNEKRVIPLKRGNKKGNKKEDAGKWDCCEWKWGTCLAF